VGYFLPYNKPKVGLLITQKSDIRKDGNKEVWNIGNVRITGPSLWENNGNGLILWKIVYLWTDY
jgi:hypothetical protein